MDNSKTLIFNRKSFERELTINDYIDGVTYAHKLHAEDKVIETNLIHADAPNGEYHLKSGGLIGDRSYYGLKANGGFFNNMRDYKLPNILGVIYLSNAENGYPLAIFESSLISKYRTAAATAVAAKYLKPFGEIKMGIIGYGNQAEAHIYSILAVTEVSSISVAGRDIEKVKQFVYKIRGKINTPLEISNVEDLSRSCNLIITTTISKSPLIKKEWIEKGTFIAAIGADSPGKCELDPEIIKMGKVIADIKSQVIKVGESQHAIKNGLIVEDDIYGELGDLITGKVDGRKDDEEIFIYDSTGTAIQDISCAAYIYEKLKDSDKIKSIDLFS